MQLETSTHEAINNTVTVQTLIAAAGADKTGMTLRKAAETHKTLKTVFAVRTINTGKDIERRLTVDQFNIPQKYIKRVDSEESQPGLVMVDLEAALNDELISIVICTHAALVRFPKWHEYAGKFALNIDELPEAIELAYASFGIKSARGIVQQYGIDSNAEGSNNDLEAQQLVDAINHDPSIFQAYANELFEEDSTTSEDKTWGNQVLNLFKIAKDAKQNHIYATIYNIDGETKIYISAIKKSDIFGILSNFNTITLTTMLFDGHIFKRIGEASGLKFVDFYWEHQRKPFDNSSNITLVVMTDLDKMSSRSQMDKVDNENNSLFKRAIRRLVTLECFQPENASPDSKRNKIMLYTNEARKKEISQMKLTDRFEFLPYCTHGLKDWQTENLFAAFLTFRWREIYNTVGNRFSEDLGISFETLKNEYNFTQMIEPIAQAITRGVVRDHKIKNVKSWIALPDLYTAEVIKKKLFPDAIIDTQHMVSTDDNIDNRPVGRSSSWQAVSAREICKTANDSKWVYRNIDRISNYFKKQLDCTNPIDITLVAWYLSKFEPYRTLYPEQCAVWDMGRPYGFEA